jgi:pentatricopeptide repeat protein
MYILGNLQEGKMIHDYKIWNGFVSHAIVENSLIYFYAKCESIDISHLIFHEISKRTIVSWNEMITWYGENGYAKESLMFFHNMQHAILKLNLVITMASVFHACVKFED